MKTLTLQKKLQKKEIYKRGFAYKMVCDFVNNVSRLDINGNVLRPCHTSGHGRFTTNLDYTKDVEMYLTVIKVKFESGNDSPRNGKTGNYIKVLTKISR